MQLVRARARRPDESLVGWMVSFFQPHRGRVALLGSLSLAEIALRTLAPLPLRVLVDGLVRGDRRAALLFGAVGAGLGIQLAHQLVLMVHTQSQTKLAHLIVFDLRSRLFGHLQYLSLTHHQKYPTADAVYRLETDAGCLESLLLRGMFPSVFSA